MSRKKITYKKKNNNNQIQQLINYIMIDGKKNKAENIVNKAIFKCKKDTEAIELFYNAIQNITPKTEIKSRKIGGATYQIPVEIKKKRALSMALKWLVIFARKRKDKKNIIEKLKEEIKDANNKQGGAYKKKEEVHKMAESNKAFSHYKWQ